MNVLETQGVPDEKIVEKYWSRGGKVPLFERSNQPRSLPFVVCAVLIMIVL
jgi:hypothetical protein